ncbi:MAG TPA: urease accessory UreF family protein [Solirubrobacteraceae bacterium]|nr:urease accessory UreF family protein [Solirubrobacteraceae bacterium]
MLDLLLADARTPTGGFAHSNGVEPADIEPAELEAFLRGRLSTTGLVDAAVAAAAARGEEPLALEAAWIARTPSAPIRDAARRQGRSLLRVAERLWPGALDSYSAASAGTPRPVVLGLCGSLAGLSARRVAQLCLYDDAATCCAAMPKLGAVDALDVTAVLAASEGLIAGLADRAVAARELPSAAAPLLDLRSVAHHENHRRLFAT